MRQRASGWRARVPRPEQGASSRMRSKGGPPMAPGMAASAVSGSIALSPRRRALSRRRRRRPSERSTATTVPASPISSARWVLLPPGAAQASSSRSPGWGSSRGAIDLGRAVLHAPVAFGVAGQGAQITAAATEAEAPGQIRQRFGAHAGGGEGLDHPLTAGAQAVHAQIQGGGLVGRQGKGLSPLRRQPLQQPGGQPGGQGAAQGQGSGGISWGAAGAPRGRRLGRGAAAGAGRPAAGHSPPAPGGRGHRAWRSRRWCSPPPRPAPGP